jgi:hypothetical protein
MAPKMATPVVPPTWHAVFSTADAVPARCLSTLNKIDVVRAGTIVGVGGIEEGQ